MLPGHFTASSVGQTTSSKLSADLAEADQPGLGAVPHFALRQGDGIPGLQRGALHQLLVGSIGDGEGDVDAPGRAVARPVLEPPVEQLGIGQQYVDIVRRDERRRARADGPDRAFRVRVRLDEIADFDAAVEQEDEAAHEIAHDILKAQAHADAERAGKQRQGGEIDPERRNRDGDTGENDDIARDLRADIDRRGARLRPPRKKAAGRRGI